MRAFSAIHRKATLTSVDSSTTGADRRRGRRRATIAACAAVVASVMTLAMYAGPAVAVDSVPSTAPAGAATPNIFVPCSGPNGGTAGLDAAITAANAAGGGTITLSPRCTYPVTTVANSLWGGGLTDVTSTITINGQGATITRASAAQMHLFVVESSGDLTVKGVRLTGGLADTGGAVLNFGKLTVIASDVVGNGAVGGNVNGDDLAQGGGISSGSGSVTVIGSWIHGNTASSGETFAAGGGIYTQDTNVTVEFSVISANRVIATNNAGGEGGGLGSFGGSLVVKDSLITGNTVTAQDGNQSGGGIFLPFGTVSLERSLVVANDPDNCYPAIQGCSS